MSPGNTKKKPHQISVTAKAYERLAIESEATGKPIARIVEDGINRALDKLGAP